MKGNKTNRSPRPQSNGCKINGDADRNTHSEITNGEPPKKKIKNIKMFTDVEIMHAIYTYLKCNGNFYRRKNWSAMLEKYMHSSEPMVKWLCCRSLAIITGMNEAELNSFINQMLTDEVATKCLVEYYTQLENKDPVDLDFLNDDSIERIKQVSIQGINLPVIKASGKTHFPKIIEVASTKSNLRKIALGIASKKAICLQGPVGSGKTTLIEYLAVKTGRSLGESFIKIQLGDQTDSKMLLGTYRCTDIPGEFVWQPGVLTQAVLEGSWLLLEDIDSASVDIASVLSSLLENGYLTVPGYRDFLPITPGFQLFLTQRLMTTITGHHKKQSNATTLLEKHVLQIHIEPLSNMELTEIIKSLYPPLASICGRIISVFSIFSVQKNTTSLININTRNRLISTRDLFKWCARAVIDFDVSSQSSALKVLQDAIDLFCSSWADIEQRLKLAVEISSQLGIINEKADYFCNKYKPSLSLTNEHLKAGRASIKRKATVMNRHINFCFTRPSACLLERVMCCVMLKEPVLLVGETGTGKTSSVQYLAHTIGQRLIVINMNQQSDSADLLGGFKPVDLKYVVAPVKAQFEEVFCNFFNVDQNQKFLNNISICYNSQKWDYILILMKKSYQAAMTRLQNEGIAKSGEKRSLKESNNDFNDAELKHQKSLKAWTEIGVKLHKLEIQLKQKNALAFSFIEGSLVKAIENGQWVLLDEINLANAETLECLSGLLEGSEGSLSLLERGDKKPVKRHPNFTLFACMNPSTDVGKRDLPAGLRNRFTEFFVDELIDRNDLILLVNSYLNAMSLKTDKIENIVKFYLNVRREATSSLTDGLGQKPHFSLRSLCRALTIASKNPCGTFNRSLYEAFCLSFLTQLDTKSYQAVETLIGKYTVGTAKELKAVIKQPIPEPKGESCLQFEGYWIPTGTLEPSTPDNYILTDSVRKNLKDLARIVSIGKLPVLLQGDTSVGKTSLITYLAKASGNKCVRINNHEHTDLQEYIGSYVADTEGKLVFREGLLVQAMRQGYWIILDELNLAPTDVLEALNRVLDDNRELFIPETQDIVKADPNFMLFATQNPPGTYGGRKMLSRAFRNRLVELHFMEIPPDELEFILHKRCNMPLSYAKKMINVMRELQTRRRGSAAFAGKHGFITLRDLFRWGERYRLAEDTNNLYDWDQHIADEGYLVLAGRVRKSEEKIQIAEVIKKHIKRSVNPENLFTLSKDTSAVTRDILDKIHQNKEKHQNIVWTYNMRQLAVLVSKALQFKEPVLLVGETGGGKTTVCQLLADNSRRKLVTVNCHMNTESSDFLGGLRPVRDHTSEDIHKLFEWVDGPLVQAMQNGDVFLADEISLADDSVLERMNSLLEPERTLLLAEKGADINSSNNSETIVAHEGFCFIGTMNPGGDFGKKELSPALRNRFTEIWCESCTKREDLVAIIERNIKPKISLCNQEDGTSGFGKYIMDFIEWLKDTEVGKKFTISIRDILTWVSFINSVASKVDISEAYLHGASLTFLDSLGSGVTSGEHNDILNKFRNTCKKFFMNQLTESHISLMLSIDDFVQCKVSVQRDGKYFGIKPFYLECSENVMESTDFSFNTPTTTYNALRLLRGLQLNKAILLEGSPGVGKTSLVTALAKRTGNKLFRVNLSDQTDISDLFGADLPVEGGVGGQFAWRDGPLLQALKKGHWILLDELNLASQSVLEGLNACLDHRGEIFIPELGKTFHVKPGTKFFGCQNPLKQGGSRRGLPQSFLNRFIQVYIDSMKNEDLLFILVSQFPKLPKDMLANMVKFNDVMVGELERHSFGHKGAPWECNLRDLTRWCEAVLFNFESNLSGDKRYKPENLVDLIYGDRMRTQNDKDKVREIFKTVFGLDVSGDKIVPYVTPQCIHMGDVCIERETRSCNLNIIKQDETALLLRSQNQILRNLMYCVNLNWMSIIAGPTGVGKSAVVKTLANLVGKNLYTLPVTSAMDTTDILGGFEQIDYTRHLEEIFKQTEILLLHTIKILLPSKRAVALNLLEKWEECTTFIRDSLPENTIMKETEHFLDKIGKLKEIWKKLKEVFKMKEFDDKIDMLVAKGDEIIKGVQQEGNLNAGGKFEWIDSILVKCLQEGSWLLVDNVNLCSPAVLDRLNGLLEPNGTLIIGERGMDKNGQMFEVKPHKEFRLFLTMDPKNGEISRAMRNRGVEIYILNDKEHNDYDTKSLVHLQGLESNDHIEKLIRIIYNNELVCGPLDDKFNDLLHSAFLISEQIKRGIKPLDAFVNTILDMYHKNKSNKENHENDVENIKEQLKNIFKEKLEAVDQNFQSKMFSKDLTLKTKNIQECSTMEIVRQYSCLVKHYITENKLNNMEHIDELRRNLFIQTFNLMSRKNLKIFEQLNRILVKDNTFRKISEVFYNEVASFIQNHQDYYDDLQIPLEMKWLPDTPFSSQRTAIENKLLLAEHFKSKQVLYEEEQLQIRQNSKNKIFTLLQYANCVQRKELEKKIDDIVLVNSLELFEGFNKICSSIVSDKTIGLNNTKFIEILSSLQWRYAFYHYLKNNTIHFKMANFDEILSSLHVHYKWFVKYCLKNMTSLLKDRTHLDGLVQMINSNLTSHFSVARKVGKKYHGKINIPQPFINDVQVEFIPEINKLLFDYNICKSKFEPIKVLRFIYNQDFRNLLTELKGLCNINLVEMPMQYNSVKYGLKEFEVQNVTPEEMKFIPLQDFLSLLCVNRNICGSFTSLDLLKKTSTVPVSLVSTLHSYESSKDLRNLHELLSEAFCFKNNSLCLNPSKVMALDVANENQEENVAFFMHNPVLTYLITNVLVSTSGAKNVISTSQFGRYRDAQVLHRKISSLLWENLHSLQDTQYDLLTNESEYCIKKFTEFLEQLTMALGIPYNESLETTTNTCLSEIRRMFAETNLKDIHDDNTTLSYLLEGCLQEVLKLQQSSKNNELELLDITANIFITLNYLKAFLNSKLPAIDPLTKVTYKKKYCQEEIENFSTMKLAYELQNEVLSGSKKTLHPFCALIDEKLKQLELKEKELGDYIAVRPKSTSYVEVIKKVNHGFNTVLMPKKIIDSYKKLSDTISSLIDCIEKKHSYQLIGDIAGIQNLSRSTQFSLKNYLDSLEPFRHQYPDIIEPLYNNLVELFYGINIKSSVLVKALKNYEEMLANIDLKKNMSLLVKFPSLDSSSPNFADATSYTNAKFRDYIKEVLVSEEFKDMDKVENFRLLKCGIQEMYNYCVIDAQTSPTIDTNLFHHFNSLIRIFVISWNKQEEELAAKKKESESIYKTKTKAEVKTEDEEIEEQFKALFPNYNDKDFSDFQTKTLDDNIEEEDNEDNFTGIITFADVQFVSNLHSEFLRVFTKTEWLNPAKEHVEIDYLEPLMQKYKLFKVLLTKCMTSCSYTMDKELLGSLAVLSGIAEHFGDASKIDIPTSPSRRRKKSSDFYRDSDVEQVKSSYHILEQLKLRIQELLNEWPEQPTLKSIDLIIERIYNFDIMSPLSRFLTGFEMLLTKCHEWEQNAHSGVSLSVHIQNLIDQIITWRKIELNMWKDSLNMTFERMNDPISKWWFYIFGIMEQFIQEGSVTTEDLIASIQKFMIQSNLAEFENRLDLLRVFHCHATFFEPTKKTKIFISVLWNAHNFYSQFLTAITAKIKDLRAPIEKKLKDYVKIVRWKDVSYWAIKDTLLKTQKTLHKYMREFEDVLGQPVTPYLSNTTSERSNETIGIWDRPQRHTPKTYHYSMDVSCYIIMKSSKTSAPIKEDTVEVAFKPVRYINKARDLCKDALTKIEYPNLIKGMDGFVTEVIETSTHLQNLEIDKTLTKQKQKAHAKSILQQKHRALADLFSRLSKLGLSYRSGIIESKIQKNSEDYVLKPIDLNAALKYIETSKNDEKLLTLWQGCETYYMKALMRLDILENALHNPAKDLGIQNIARCKGFAFDIFKLARDQKASIIKSSNSLYCIRFYMKYFNEFCNNSEFIYRKHYDRLTNTLKNIMVLMQQYTIILNSCPEESSFGENLIEVPTLPINKIEFIKHKFDPIWSKISTEVTSILTVAEKLLNTLRKCNMGIPSALTKVVDFSYVPIQDLSPIQSEVNNLELKLLVLQNRFSGLTLSKNIEWIIQELKEIPLRVENINSNNCPKDEFQKENETLVENILLVIQNIYKAYESVKVAEKEETAENDEEDPTTKDNQLRGLIISNLTNDLLKLQIKPVLQKVSKVAAQIANINPATSKDHIAILSTTLPFLEQIILVYQYFITQQVSAYRITIKMSSILNNIFIELATKGFCIPPELSDEKDSGEGTQSSGGMGLDDGEGEKDVSDRIESEDQLEGAHEAGKEKQKEEDKDLKEDKGIEMSEDFDSKLQDVEKKDQEDENEQSDQDSDADEQMGETEEGADQLDKQVWGSDDEDVNDDGDEGKEEKEEKGDKGEAEGEKELAANEGPKSKEDEDDVKSKEEKKEKSKKDINEMDEPEFDDEQVDPYHGNQPELPEPEALDLPDDLQLDDGQEKEENNEEENPFDIDKMKEQTVPEEKSEEEEQNTQGEEDASKENDDSSSDEEINVGDNEEPMETENVEDNENEESKDNKTVQEDAESENPDLNKEDQTGLDQNSTADAQAQAMDTEDAECADNVQTNPSKDNKASQQNKEVSQEDNPDKDGVGQSEIEESKTGHKGKANLQQESAAQRDSDTQEERKRKPGESDERRSLGDTSQPIKKKLKTMNLKENHLEEENEDEGAEHDDEAEMYQHIKEAKTSDDQILDSATSDQAEKQEEEIKKLEEKGEEVTESKEDLPEEDEEMDVDAQDIKQQKAEKLETEKKKNSNKKQHPDGEVETIENVDIEGEIVQRMTVARGDTTYHTALENVSFNDQLTLDSREKDWVEPCGPDIVPTSIEEQEWQKISGITASLAQNLAEQLRLVLEPTQATRLKGDFKTGRRINMRKVIPYIASQFRKDKIWLRRTKPAKREYQIVLAIDNSSSMADNHSKELAYQSVALLSKALSLLESGQLSVISFGEEPQIVHKLVDTFSDRSGAKILQKFQFDQKKTNIGKMVDFTTDMLNASHRTSNALNSKLLIIVSDGRGIFSEGESYVRQAVRRAKFNNIFTVFVIIDDPKNTNSILDIRMPVFDGGKLVTIKSYMDAFPFPFYIILRDLDTLPSVLSDALRQWFEIVSNTGT